MDPRIKKLAKILVNYSCELKKDENTLIQCYGMTPLPLIRELVKEVYAAGAIPYVTLKDDTVLREVIKECRADQLGLMTRHDCRN